MAAIELVPKKQGGPAHAGLSAWRFSGYLFNRLWIYTIFFSSVLFAPFTAESRGVVFNDVYLASVVFLTAVLALCALSHRSAMRLLDNAACRYVGPAIAGIGVLLLAHEAISGGMLAPGAVIAVGVFTGLGSALVLLEIGRSYSAADAKTCSLEVLAATALAAALSVALFFLPYPCAVAIVVASPFLAEFCAAKTLEHHAQTTPQPSGEKLPKLLLIKFSLFALAVGAATGLMRDVYSLHGMNAFGVEYGVLFAIASCLVAAMLALVIATNKRFSIDLLTKPVVLLCVIGFASFTVWTTESFPSYLIVTLGYTLFEVVIWVILAEMAGRFQYTSIQVFGFGRALVLAVGMLMGAPIARAMASGGPTDSGVFAAMCAIAVGLIAFARLYVLTESDISRFEGNLAPDMESADPTETEASPATSEEGAPAPKSRKIPLLARCRIIGAYYGLSKREVDVFHLLACGRNAARIQEELVISAGTVNTHTRHIYQKLSIHAQQELIDLMQEADLDMMEKTIAERSAANA